LLSQVTSPNLCFWLRTCIYILFVLFLSRFWADLRIWLLIFGPSNRLWLNSNCSWILYLTGLVSLTTYIALMKQNCYKQLWTHIICIITCFVKSEFFRFIKCMNDSLNHIFIIDQVFISLLNWCNLLIGIHC
jgi:hypothetical protein